MAVAIRRYGRAPALDRIDLAVKRGGHVDEHVRPLAQHLDPLERGCPASLHRPMFNPHAMGSISPVSASLLTQAASGTDLSSQVAVSVEHTILSQATQSMSDLLGGLSTTGTTGRFINALA